MDCRTVGVIVVITLLLYDCGIMGAVDLWRSKVAGYSEIDPYAVSGLLYLTAYFFVIDNSKKVINDKGFYMHHGDLLQLATLGTTKLQLVYTPDCNSSFYFGFVTCNIVGNIVLGGHVVN